MINGHPQAVVFGFGILLVGISIVLALVTAGNGRIVLPPESQRYAAILGHPRTRLACLALGLLLIGVAIAIPRSVAS